MKRLPIGLILLVLLASHRTGSPPVSAQESGTPGATPAAATTAVYLIIANDGCMPDQLVGATTDVADAVEIHETAKEDGAVVMRPLPDGLTILAGSTAKLEPGGDHLMLIGLREDLVAGNSFLLSLTFLFAGDVSVPVTVRDGSAPAAAVTPPAPVAIGTIRVADAWTPAAASPSGTPAAVAP